MGKGIEDGFTTLYDGIYPNAVWQGTSIENIKGDVQKMRIKSAILIPVTATRFGWLSKKELEELVWVFYY